MCIRDSPLVKQKTAYEITTGLVGSEMCIRDRSQLAAIELIKSGYSAQRLYNLEGGIMAWNATAPDEVIG